MKCTSVSCGVLCLVFALLCLSAGYSDAQTLAVQSQRQVDIISRSVHTITIVNSNTPNSRDFVVVVPANVLAGKETFTATNWRYLNNKGSGFKPVPPLKSGTVTLATNGTGRWEVRFYSLTDSNVQVLQQTFPLVIEPIKEISTNTTGLIIKRRADSLDQVTISEDSKGSGTLTAPAGMVVKP